MRDSDLHVIDREAASLDLARLMPPERPAKPLQALDLHELARHQFKPREPILVPFLNTQETAMIYAPRGIGKTHFAIAMLFAVATGTTFARWSAPVPRRVLLLDGEMSGTAMQERLAMHCGEVEPEPGFFRIFTPDLLTDEQTLPDISTPEGQFHIDGMIGDAEVVVIDNLSAWARTGRENESESWVPVSEWLMSLRRRGITVILIHHAGKSGQQRGTSKREDNLDVVLSLSHPCDYEPSQGATFVCEYTKARHFTGEDAKSIELSLTENNGTATWTWRTVEASTYERCLALALEGLKPGEICAELDLNKSTVSRHLKKARQLGELKEGQP